MNAPRQRPYTPISCALHDCLEAAATRRRIVTIEFRPAPLGDIERVEDGITDIVVRGGVEYVLLASGREIRLDDLVRVEDTDFQRQDPQC